jgi:acetylornithine deacetylase/succinyl-diaminopimelate desuccinylase-like protein
MSGTNENEETTTYYPKRCRPGECRASRMRCPTHRIAGSLSAGGVVGFEAHNGYVSDQAHQLWVIACRDLGEPEPQLVGSIGGGRGTLADMGPVMHFGAGGGVGAHAPDEYALVDRLVAGARLHAHLYEKVLSSTAASSV